MRGAFLASVMAVALAGCGADALPEAAPVVAAPKGEQLRLAAATIPEMRRVSGEIRTRDDVAVPARIGGTLVSITVKAGDIVRAGQRLGMVRDTRLGFETGAATAQLRAAEADAARSTAALRRIEDLYRNKVYSAAALEAAQAEARAAQAGVAAARAAAGASGDMQAQGALVAPANGRVLSADVPLGAVVMPGQPVVRVTAGPLVVRLMLPEALAGALRPGLAVTLEGDFAGTGRLVQVYPGVLAGQVMADAAVEGLDDRFLGRRVTARLQTGTRQALVLPKRFLSTRYGVDFVDVLSGNAVSAVPVQVAAIAGTDDVEILSGVAAGDVVLGK